MAKLKGKAKAAFLRRMARGRNKRTTKRRRKARRKVTTMARKRRKSTSRRRRSGGRRRSSRRRGGAGGYAIKPSGEDIKLWGAMAGVGLLESKAKADDSFLANKIPKLIDPIGFTGNLAVFLWGMSYLLKNRWLRLGGRAAAGITAYQLGRKGGTFSSGKDFFVVSGYDDDDVREMLDTAMGALQADGEGGDGLSWDAAAENAMQMVGD